MNKLRQLRLSRDLAAKRKALEELTAKGEELKKQRAALAVKETAVEDAVKEITDESSEEDRAAVDAEIAELEPQVEECESALAENETASVNLRNEIDQLQSELEELQSKVDAVPAAAPAAEEAQRSVKPAENHDFGTEERKGSNMKNIRSILRKMQEDNRIFEREDVKTYLAEVRSSIREKRALTNAGLLIPQVFLGLLRENISEYSKLYKHVNVRPIGGTGREVVMGTVPEAIWTDCCANLNELTIGFNDAEVDCFKAGGYFAVCNALIEDADIDLAAELLTVMGQAIGLALDKAILYGRNAVTTQKMPQGVVSRLAQTAAPAGYPATARTWEDLHETHIVIIPASATGVALYQAIVTASGLAKGKYSRGEKVWVMNDTTYTTLKAQAMSFNAAGAVVSGIEGTMPVAGGVVEVLDFIPDNVIIAGYFDLYLLAERAGAKFATSEHVRFIQDQTVFKGTARYDGQPVIAEAFIALGINGTTPTAAMSFPVDTANA